MFGVIIFVSCLVLACTADDCPECPKNPFPCSSFLTFEKPCQCSVCFTLCSIRKPVCKKGEVCTMEDVYFGKDLAGQSAACKPFKQCPQIQCPNTKCPESGYFVDQNGCTTCLCKDPCKELKCPGGACGTSSHVPGSEPKYACIKP